ncbi:MAG: hypothetical protein JNM72_14170 [Deltaproteobacteria bacterium]|nr:hypothetical protein [Deltaproteobacteria bacterium]
MPTARRILMHSRRARLAERPLPPPPGAEAPVAAHLAWCVERCDRGRFDEAATALGLLCADPRANARQRAAAHAALGRGLRFAGHHTEGLAAHAAAVALGREAGLDPTRLGMLLHELSVALDDDGQADKAAVCLAEAMALFAADAG